MRNLKRALSLALASVMVMGLAVVGSNASYVDVTSKQNQEAIEVLQKIGIMVGDENGKFNPEAKVTRNEMAVIMANLMDYRVSTYKGTSPFTDVPAWAEPYVAACYTNGIVSGYDAKTFGGSDPVSTSQAALMLMKALGYFQYQSDFENDWQLATVKQGNKIDLFDDVDSNVRESMTRNDVAQLVLNALKSGTVEADDDTIKVVTGDTKVEAGKVKYNYITSNKDYAYAIDFKLGAATGADQISGNIVQLGEKLYQGDLKLKDDAADDFWAPANRWTYKNQEIGTYAKSPDYTFSGVVKSSAMYDAVGKTAANYSWAVYTDGKEGYLPDGSNYDGHNGRTGSTDTQTAIRKDNKEDLEATTRGSETYVYLDDTPFVASDGTKFKGSATMVVKKLYVGEITKVKDGTVTIDDMDNNALDFDVTGYAEGDMVLYNKSFKQGSYDGEVQAIVGKAELKEGTLETVRDKDRIVIDGTTYKYADRFNDVNDGKLDTDAVNQTVSFYMDGQGNIIAFEDTSVNQEYAFVYSMGVSTSQYGKDTDIGAKLVLADGTVKSVIIDSDDIKTAETKTGKAELAAAKEYFGWSIVSYSQNDNGTYSITKRTNGTSGELAAYKAIDFTNNAIGNVIKGGTSRVKTPTGEVSVDKNTVFLVNEFNEDGDDFKVYVGYNNVPNVDAVKTASANEGKLMGDATERSDSEGNDYISGIATYSRNGVAKIVVLTDAQVSGSSNDVIFVVGNKKPGVNKTDVNKTGSTEYYVYDAVVNGEVTTIKVKASSPAQATMNNIENGPEGKNVGVFFGMTKNSAGYVTKFNTQTPKDVKVNDQVTNGSTYAIMQTGITGFEYIGTKRESNGGNIGFEYDEDAKEYTESFAANDKATIVYYDGEDLSVTNRVNTDTNDHALVITDDRDVIAILVREFKDSTSLTHG